MLLSLVLYAALAAPAPPRFDATQMMKLKRLGDPQLSPDGRWVAYEATDVSLQAGTKNADIWVVPADPRAASGPRRITDHAASDTRPRWSPDGRRIAFVSARDGASQVYVVDAPGGGIARKVTSLATEAGGVLWIDDRTLLVTSDAYPACDGAADFDDPCQKTRLDAVGKPSSARVYDRLLFRHWDTWDDDRRTHLLVVPVDGGAARDLTPGDRDVPPFSLGGADDYAVSPDGAEVCFARKDDVVEATSTNADLFVVPTRGGTPVKISASAGYDGAPRYSPDGTRIAFRSQRRAGFEADRWRLMVYDRRTRALRSLADDLDRHVESFAWSPDSATVYFTAGDNARQPIYSVPAAGGAVTTVRAGDGTFDDIRVAPDGHSLVATLVTATHPAEICRVSADGSAIARLTHVNDAVLEMFSLRPGESVTYAGAAEKPVQAWIFKPSNFDPAKKYPLLVLIHGGPQGVWGDAWSFRWNYQVFANAGYVVFAPNPRGSIGWGQEFVDDITLDWEGKAYEDVMRGTDYAEALPYVEKGRTAAAGASYGGYLINWIAGHTDRFRALVSHDGIFDLRSMYASTEELWFADSEFGGTPWERPEFYLRASPSRFVTHFKTPTLVVHGEKDYRVPIEQGLGMFTALQLRGVPSRLVIFPDENHWVLKPANSVRWYDEVLGWLDRWTKG